MFHSIVVLGEKSVTKNIFVSRRDLNFKIMDASGSPFAVGIK